MSRRKVRGISVPTLKRYLDEMRLEAREMGVDGRLARSDARRVELKLLEAMRSVR